MSALFRWPCSSISIHLSPRRFLYFCLPGFWTFVSQVRCLRCWCLPFSAGHAAFLFICLLRCLSCDFFTFVSPGSVPALLVSALFRSTHLSPMYSCLPLSPVLLPLRWLLSRVLNVRLVSLCLWSCLPSCGPQCPLSPVLSTFLLVTVSALSPFCLSLLVGHCVRLVSFCFLSSPFLSPFLLVIVSVLSPLCFLLSPFLSRHSWETTEWKCCVASGKRAGTSSAGTEPGRQKWSHQQCRHRTWQTKVKTSHGNQ